MKQYSLKTLPKKMSCRELCLNHLGAILDEFSGRLLVRELAYIGKILNQANSFEEGDAELIAKYASDLILRFRSTLVSSHIFVHRALLNKKPRMPNLRNWKKMARLDAYNRSRM
jgi:hypothetical protein